MKLAVILLLLPSIAFAGLSDWSVDISLNEDRSADWTVVFKYNESMQKSDYFVLSRIENLRVLADTLPVQCSVIENIGTNIVCENIFASNIVYKFRSAEAVEPLQNLLSFKQRFGLTQLTDKFTVIIRLPLGTALVEKARLEGTGLSRFEPSWGREGSDGRRIFVEWVATEPKLGETHDIGVVFEKVAGNESSVLPIFLIVVITGAVIYLAFFKKTGVEDVLPVLTENERKVMEIIIRENKSVDQRKLVKDLDFSKPKISRIIKDLSDRGLVEKTRKGRTNIIKLKKVKNQHEKQESSKPQERRQNILL